MLRPPGRALHLAVGDEPGGLERRQVLAGRRDGHVERLGELLGAGLAAPLQHIEELPARALQPGGAAQLRLQHARSLHSASWRNECNA